MRIRVNFMHKNKHQGRVLERVIKQRGFTLTTLAKRLSISRKSLYDKFNMHKLPPKFVLSVGNILGYKSKSLLPGLLITNSDDFSTYLNDISFEYIALLEDYLKLIELLIDGMIKNIDDKNLVKKINKFIKDEGKIFDGFD